MIEVDPPLFIETNQIQWTPTISYTYYIVKCKEEFCSEFVLNAFHQETAVGLAEWHRERCGQMVWRRVR